MAIYGEINKCPKCKNDTTSVTPWNKVCERCRMIKSLNYASKRITAIEEYITSDGPLKHVKRFSDWKKSRRGRVEVSFYGSSDNDPVAQGGIGENAHILCIPKSLGGGDNVVVVGKDEKGWWLRNGSWHKNRLDDNGSRFHEITLFPAIDNYDTRYLHRMDEALFLAIVRNTRPLMGL